MRITVDLEKENDNLTVGELRRRYEDRKVKEAVNVSEVIGKYKGKYLKVKSKFGSGYEYYHIEHLKQESYFDDFKPLFKAEVERVSLDMVTSFRQGSENFSEKALEEAKEITKEQFEKAKSIVTKYLKEVEDYEKTV